jgi:cellulose synthase/poly-beta-1,6-N-acetylglucosamine synthase-like glycosyltransferase
MPKTKPKACNYALYFSKGEYITIYDAEDRPEKDQLKKAIACFHKSAPTTAVVQARLNYFNPDENWITKMFTMEYSLWFDFFLPALERLKVPIPLGGTSNHFKASVLKSIGGWDPFNVTEDADLGIRFYQTGYTVEVLNSTTFEEANTQFGNWIRQRSRWLKGYMQTYLVHMRDPIYLYRTIGLKGFLAFQFFIGGTFFTALIAPFLYLIYFTWLFSNTTIFESIFTPTLLYISIINLLIGNSFFIYIHMIGVFKRKYFNLIPTAMTTPLYWIMLSIAGYKGLHQLFFNPFYWEKTQHGLSKELKSK